jgi:hypothetical protein
VSVVSSWDSGSRMPLELVAMQAAERAMLAS